MNSRYFVFRSGFSNRLSRPRTQVTTILSLILAIGVIIILLLLITSETGEIGSDFAPNILKSLTDLAASPLIGILSVFGLSLPKEIAAVSTITVTVLLGFLLLRSSLTKIAIKNLSRRKLRNTLTIIAVVLGVSLVVGVNISLDSSLVEFKQTIDQAAGNVDISIRSALDEPFNQSIIETVRKIEGVANASLRVSSTVGIWDPSEEKWDNAAMVGINSSSDFSYLDLNIVGNSGLLEENSSNAVIDKGLNLTIGSVFKIRIITYNFSDPLNLQSNSTEEIELTVADLYQPIQMEATEGNSHTIFVDLVRAQHILARNEKADCIIVKIENVEQTAQVVKNLGELGTSYLITPVKENILSGMIQASTGFQYGLQIMSILTVCVAVVMIINTIYLNVSERKFEIGIMRSVGASKKQVFWMFFSESIALGIIGVILGLILGIPMANGFTSLSSQFSSALMPATETFVYKPWHFVLGAIIGLSASVIGGLFPSIFASRIDVINALRPAIRKGGTPRTALKLIVLGAPLSIFSVLIFTIINQQSGSSTYSSLYVLATIVPLLMIGLVCLTAGLLRVINPVIERLLILFSSNRKIISRNIARNLMRSTICFTLIGMTLSFIIVVAGAQSGVVTGLEDVIHSFYSADLTITSETPINKSFVKDLTLINNGSMIANVAPSLIVPRTVSLLNNKSDTNSSSMLLAIDSTYSEIMSMKFNEDTPLDVFSKLESNGTIIVTSPLAVSLNATIEDEIQMPLYSVIQVPVQIPVTPSTPSYSEVFPDASHQGGTHQTPESYPVPSFTTIYVPEVKITYVNFTVIGIAVGSMLEWNHGLYSSSLSEASYISYESLNATFPEYNQTANLFFAKIKADQDVELVQKRVMELYSNKYLLNTLTVEDALNPAKDGINKTFTILNAVVMFAVVSAAIGVAAIMVMNISERQREIGILRSIGMSRRQVVMSIIGEASVLAFAGFALGTLAGLILHSVTTSFMRATGFPIPYNIPFNSIWMSLLLAIIASLVSAAYPAYHASKLKIVDSLRH